MDKIYDLIVVGGGPAGIMSAITAKRINNNLRVAILESGNDIGKKLRITGGGRCNFTNNKDVSDFFEHIVKNEKFLYSSLYTFTNENLKDFIKKDLGIEYVIEYENDDKVYISSARTDLLILRLKDLMKNLGIDIFLNSKVDDISQVDKKNLSKKTESEKIYEDKFLEGYNFIISCKNKRYYYFSRFLVLAGGGLSFPKTGSDGSLYKIISKLGIKIVKPLPSLVPIEIKKIWLSELVGLSFKEVSLKTDRREIIGDLIITHKGIGGPVTLKISSYINRNLGDLTLDMLPEKTKDEVYFAIRENQNKNLYQIFSTLRKNLPSRFLKLMLSECSKNNPSFDFEKAKVANLSKENFEYLLTYIKNIRLEVVRLKDISFATVTSGGVDVSEIDPSTLESKKISGLYFAGELIDVDALTGGYNLQIAFSTGFLSGLSIGEIR